MMHFSAEAQEFKKKFEESMDINATLFDIQPKVEESADGATPDDKEQESVEGTTAEVVEELAKITENLTTKDE